MNLNKKSVRIRLYKRLAVALGNHGVTFKELLSNPAVADGVFRTMKKRKNITSKAMFDKLINHIRETLAFLEKQGSHSGGTGGRINPLPNLDQQDRRLYVKTRARFGKWPAD